MRAVVTLDDKLFQRATQLTGLQRGPLLDEALTALIQRESARRNATAAKKQGGQEPNQGPSD